MNSTYQDLKLYFRKVNWKLFLFLVLFLNVKLIVKLAVLLLFLWLSRDMKGLKDFSRQRYTWFYGIMIALGVMNILWHLSPFSASRLVMVLTGVSFWLLCLGAAWIVYHYVKKSDTASLHASISLFFLLNAGITFLQLLLIIWDAGAINPYTYQGMNQKYFISTGDLLRGISFDVSTTNAFLNAFGVVYFLDRQKTGAVLACFAALLLTASNFVNLLLLFTLALIFLFQSRPAQKSMILLCACLFIIFISKISPQNQRYLKYVYQKLTHKKIDTLPPDIGKPPLLSLPDSILDAEQLRRKTAMLYLDSVRKSGRGESTVIARSAETQTEKETAPALKPSLPKPNIHAAPYQRLRDTSESQRQLIAFAVHRIEAFDTSLEQTQKKLPGKIRAWQQTLSYFRDHPALLLTGTGAGAFSSRLAFRATGLGFAGRYPQQFAYSTDAFRDNHFRLYLEYFSKDKELHSLLNSPDSVYDQLFSEYGLLGILAFLLLYARYFMKGITRHGYALPLLVLLAGGFLVGYWFEQLSIVIIFECLMLIHQKEKITVLQ